MADKSINYPCNGAKMLTEVVIDVGMEKPDLRTFQTLSGTKNQNNEINVTKRRTIH